MKLRLSVNALVLVLSALTVSAQNYPYVLTDLGTVPGNTTSPQAWGINETGDMTVGWSSYPTLGWVHTASGMALVGTLPGCAFSTAWDVNDAGQIVGSSWAASIDNPGNAYRKTPGTGMVNLGTLGGTKSDARRINNAGQVVGDSLVAGDNSHMHAFLYTDGTGMVSLAPSAAISHGSGISHNGQATGSMTVGNNWHAFRYIPGVGLSDLGLPPGYAHSYGAAINDLGQVAGTVAFSGSTYPQLFRWTPGSGYQIFGNNAPFTSCWAINASGTVVGISPIGGYYRAVMFADGMGLVDLNTLIDPATGWSLRVASDINDRGQIVGYGTVAGGATHAFRLDPAASFAAFGTGCAGTAGVPLLAAAPGSLPRLGSTLIMQLSSLPAPTVVVFGILGLSNTSFAGAPLPLSLNVIGMNGCTQYVSFDLALSLPAAAGTANWPLAVPSNLALQGFHLYAQSLVPDGGVNPFGATVSNAAAITLGG